MFIFNFRVIVFTMALSFMICASAVENNKIKKSDHRKEKNSSDSALKQETYKEIISKAQLLMLQKDRAQAINTLLLAIQREEPKGVPQAELVKVLHKITNIFVNENSQSDFELALSIEKNDKKAAIDKLNEILKIEAQNIQVVKALILSNLALRNCSQAQKNYDLSLKIDPLDLDLSYLDVDIAICLKNTKKYLELKSKYEIVHSIPLEFWYLGDNRINLLPTERSSEFIFSEDHKEKVNPEVLYYKWKNPELSKSDRFSFAEEYVKVCKNRKTGYKINNYLDPWICENLKEVEDGKDKN